MKDFLSFLLKDLDNYLKHKFSTRETKVVLSNLINPDGSVPENNEFKIVATLVSFKREEVRKVAAPQFSSSGESHVKTPPGIMEMQVMLTSFFPGENYAEGLEYLEEVLAFFENRVVYTRQTNPNLPEGVEKAMLELLAPGTEEMNRIFRTHGVSYLPSALFRIRLNKSNEKEEPATLSEVTKVDISSDSDES